VKIFLAKTASLARRSAGILPARNATFALKSVRLREGCAGHTESAGRKALFQNVRFLSLLEISA
jgi:hypothetical protein